MYRNHFLLKYFICSAAYFAVQKFVYCPLLIVNCLGDIIYFGRIFTWPLQRRESRYNCQVMDVLPRAIDMLFHLCNTSMMLVIV